MKAASGTALEKCQRDSLKQERVWLETVWRNSDMDIWDILQSLDFCSIVVNFNTSVWVARLFHHILPLFWDYLWESAGLRISVLAEVLDKLWHSAFMMDGHYGYYNYTFD